MMLSVAEVIFTVGIVDYVKCLRSWIIKILIGTKLKSSVALWAVKYKKGSPAECINHRPMLRSHSMRIFVGIRNIVQLTVNQVGFSKSCGATDEILAPLLHMEKRHSLYSSRSREGICPYAAQVHLQYSEETPSAIGTRGVV